MSALRWLLLALGLSVWALGLYLFIGGAYALGGCLVVGGGLCFVTAATGGWAQLVEGVTNWLYFWR
jgi:hypothetical protein